MKKWLINLTLVLVFPVGILLLDGCYPSDSLTVDQTDIVLTGYYDSVNFKSLKTYYLHDTVYPVRDDTSDKSLVPNNDLIISDIADNMNNYGYTRVYPENEDPEPDVIITCAAISVTTVSVGWWYPYYPYYGWGWYKSSSAERGTDYWYGGYYPGYYPPGWGWGGVPYYSSYTTGTLLMEMSNPNDFRVVDNDTVVPMYWAGAVSGVLSGGDNTSRITSGIDQAFTQSSYLKNN